MRATGEQRAVYAAGRRRGDVADHDASAREPASSPSSTRRAPWGPEAGDQLVRGVGRLARAVGGVMSTTKAKKNAKARRPGARSPRPLAPSRRCRRAPRRRLRSRRSPITRSCRTATPARWSRPTARSTGCASRALTRRACSVRCSTARRRVSPRAVRDQRAEQPGLSAGKDTLVTTWKTTSGWAEGTRRLDDGPAAARTRSHRTRARPTDEDADHVLVRTVEVHRRQRRGGTRVRAGIQLRPGALRTGRCRRTATRADATGAGQTIRPADRHAARDRGRPRPRPARPRARASSCFVRARPGTTRLPVPTTLEEANGQLEATTTVLAPLARDGRASPTTSSAPLIQRSALDDQGTDVHADRARPSRR